MCPTASQSAMLLAGGWLSAVMLQRSARLLAELFPGFVPPADLPPDKAEVGSANRAAWSRTP